MKNKLIYPMVVVVLAACGGDGERGNRAGQQYETVQEGSASGVTSTIAGPGESLPPITGTNADTTSAFALNPNVAPQPVPGTGAIPSAPPYSDAAVATMTPMSGSSPSAPRTRSVAVAPQPQRQAERPAYNPAPMTSASQPVQQEPVRTAQPQPREAQPVEEPVTTSGPANDTTATNTAPPPAAEPQPQRPPQREDEEPIEEEPPPPPPPAA